MTARTCPVHGEYSETGVCRWCESKPVTLLDVARSGPNARLMPVIEPTPWAGGRQVPAEEIAEAIRERRFAKPLTAFTWEDGARVCNVDATTLKPGTSVFDAMVEVWARIVRARLQDDMVEGRYLTFDATECSRSLHAQHAALRWERVARRWNYKHRGSGGDEEGRAYVWRWWLEQMDRQSAGLPLAGPFPLGFYAW